MPDHTKKNPLIQQDDRIYPVKLNTDPEKVTELTVREDQSLERSNDKSNRQIELLREQAIILMEQAETVEIEAKIRAKIHEVEFHFAPVVNKTYYLYEKYGECQMSLIGPHEWKGQAPYGVCLAQVKQLSDLTWEISEHMNL